MKAEELSLATAKKRPLAFPGAGSSQRRKLEKHPCSSRGWGWRGQPSWGRNERPKSQRHAATVASTDGAEHRMPCRNLPKCGFSPLTAWWPPARARCSRRVAPMRIPSLPRCRAHPIFQRHKLPMVKPKAAALCVQTASPPCKWCTWQSPTRSDRRTSSPAAGGAAPKAPAVETQPAALEGASAPTIPGYRNQPRLCGQGHLRIVYIEFS